MKKLRPRLYDPEKDYSDIQEWVLYNGHVFPLEEFLPGVGAVVEDEDGHKYGCGFLILSTNEISMSFLEWVYFNPKNTPKETAVAMRHIVKSMELCATDEDAPLMVTFSPSESMTRIYEKMGWIASARNMTQLMKRTDLNEHCTKTNTMPPKE